jgi:hypothetical protein
MILHECTHQFHLAGSTARSVSQYYEEGLAEHFATHLWNEGKYTPAIPDLECRDRSPLALHAFIERHHGSFRSLATDSSEADYDEAWALVTFLISERSQEFHRWADALDGGVDPTSAYNAAFKDTSDDVWNKQFLDWLQAHQNAWVASSGTWWNPSKGTLQATASGKVWAHAFTNTSRSFLEVGVHVTGDHAVAGLGMAGKKTPWRQIVVNQEGAVWLFVDDKWIPDRPDKRMHVHDPANFKFQVALEHSRATVRIDGVVAVELEVPDENGLDLCIADGSATFSNILSR